MVLENFLDAHYKNGIDISVVTNAAHYLRGKAEHEELPSVQRWSDYAAEVQQKYAGTLYCFATILPCGGPAFIKEAERAIRELGLKGIFIHSSHKGIIPTTTRHARSGSWSRRSMCRRLLELPVAADASA